MATLNKKASIIIKKWRLYKFRKMMNRYRNAAITIQAWCKGRWCRKVYKKVLIATLTIQRLSRSFILKRLFARDVQL